MVGLEEEVEGKNKQTIVAFTFSFHFISIVLGAYICFTTSQ